nr:hypothetical protein [Thiocystis violacea]
MRFSQARGNQPDLILAPIVVRHHDKTIQAVQPKRHETLFGMVAVLDGDGLVIVKNAFDIRQDRPDVFGG